MIKNDGSVIHFNNPKAQASLAANTFAITGHSEQKEVSFHVFFPLSVSLCLFFFAFVQSMAWHAVTTSGCRYTYKMRIIQ